MKLIERLKRDQQELSEEKVQEQNTAIFLRYTAEKIREHKKKLHQKIIDQVNIREHLIKDAKSQRRDLGEIIMKLIQDDLETKDLPQVVMKSLLDMLLDEIIGLGPMEKLLSDPNISDIMINGYKQVFVERFGKIELLDMQFDDNAHLLGIIQRMVAKVGRRVDESSPMVDARLPDGSRVNAVVMPIALDGPALSIRRFGKRMTNLADLHAKGAASIPMLRYLRSAVQSKTNLLISGGTGSGKTTLLNLLSGLIPDEERVLTIEDSAELSLQGHHVVRMEARPANLEGKGEISIRSCVKNALRMRPDRIIIGEIRGAEVLDMLQAMNTGHEGSMGTIHSNHPEEAMDRLMMMLALSDLGLSTESMAQFIARSVRVVVQVARFLDGKRRLTHIAEVGENQGSRVEIKVIYEYKILEQQFVQVHPSSLLQRFQEHHASIDFDKDTL